MDSPPLSRSLLGTMYAGFLLMGAGPLALAVLMAGAALAAFSSRRKTRG